MKTKIIKFVTPALAIIFAIATSAFTAVHNASADDFIINEGYIQPNPEEPCQKVDNLDCSLSGTLYCTDNSMNQAYRILSGTSCSVPLRRPSN